eukprot:CAMPEP_0198250408 /NCGR_PEP_ID=MMETSP1447-20131203/1613_1 /TAXON_ID=420782 /ORGANISM="Chaetoceros dichaeta, Strain CCMP1751" /LENGTH=31 /DNA_ID= /DNA_START= /DNA_END= /DNA_ORIENTATION=
MSSSLREIAEDSESWNEKEEQKGDVVGVAEI